MAEEDIGSTGGDDFDIDLPLSSSEGVGGSSTPAERPTPSTPAATSTPGDPAATPAETTAPTPTPSALPDSLRAEMRKQYLPDIPGETVDQAAIRLSNHLAGKQRGMWNEAKAAKEEAAAARAEMAALREGLEPMLRAYHQQARRDQMAQQAAQIPNKEVDPVGYQTWLLERSLELEQERRVSEAEAQRLAAAEAQEAQEMEHLALIDHTGYQALAAGLGQLPGTTADPDLVRDYTTLTQTGYRAAKMQYPTASDEDIMEFLQNAQQLEIRGWVSQGIDPRAAIKQRVADLRELFRATGGAPTQAQVEQVASQPAQPAATGQPVRPASVAAQVSAESAAAARRQPLTGPAATRPAAPGQVLDPGSIEDEDDYVEMAMKGLLGSEEDRLKTNRKER